MEIQKSILAILNPQNKIVGTGFLAGDGLILTCAHVVEQATAGLNEQVSVRFALDGQETLARVGRFSPSYQQDVALLRVDSAPVGASALPMGAATSSPGHPFYAYGYAKVSNVQGIGARGLIVDVVSGGTLVQLTSQEPDHGMSGAPVLDEVRGVVIGMVTKGKGTLENDQNLRNTQTTFATSFEVFCKICPQLSVAQPIINPFGDRGRIEDVSRYFPRQPITREALDELRKRQSVSLVGETQSGKSSLLWYLTQVGPQLLNVSTRDFAYFDLQLVRSEDDFFEMMCDTLGVPTTRGYQLGRALRGRHVFLCIDEIEKMTWNGFSPEIRSELRGLADGANAPLTLVIASRTPLNRLFPDTPEMTSPLAGLCSQLTIQPFTLKEALDLVCFRLNGSGHSLADADVEVAWRESGGQAVRLQKALHDVFAGHI